MNLSYKEYRIEMTDDENNSIKLWIPSAWLDDFARVAVYNVVGFKIIGGVMNDEEKGDDF